MFKKDMNLSLKSPWKKSGQSDAESESPSSPTVRSESTKRSNPLSAIKKLSLKSDSDDIDTRDYYAASPNLELDNTNPFKNDSTSSRKPNINLNKLRLGSQNDSLSNGLEDMPFGIYELQKYGIVGNVDTMAFDPIQSLMAVVTNFNHIYIFGQARVMVELKLESINPIRALKFIKGCYLIALDKNSTIYVISLIQKKVLHTLVCMSAVESFSCDYSLEFVYVGLKDGTVRAFNIETGKPTILQLNEQQTIFFPNDYNTGVKSIKIHPRDLGGF